MLEDLSLVILLAVNLLASFLGIRHRLCGWYFSGQVIFHHPFPENS